MKKDQAQHTPGPWKILPVTVAHDDWYVVPEMGSTEICRIQADHMHESKWAKRVPIAEANARLIAAAPDLREAVSACLKLFSKSNLDEMAEWSPEQKAAFDLCLFARAKVEGRA